ncbi:MAG TPA: SufD family Fe-S cluster assembly protein [Candidatus Fimihabitans intestinipullorum]|uniref:SufD family Fe-S cluster assembly protein n=1 Tax=Candidatus Fimihabitans intestinipullorum TaxID=2840820 RepID=A0A9D1HX31_9BACT|nr:SufD family Fe-S cluster assembly protein [Candidatus Fimihabitans intestinipullorum]
MDEKRETWLQQYQNVLELYKEEPKWLRQLREKSFRSYIEQPTPNFGPDVNLSIDRIFPITTNQKNQDRSFLQGGKKIVYCDLCTARDRYSKLFRLWIQHVIRYDENKYSALHTALMNGGTFIYVPPHTKVEVPFTSLFQKSNTEISSFPHTLIIVDEGSELTYVEDSKETSKRESFMISEVEIYVKKKAKCHYISFSNDTSLDHLIIKRSIVEEDGYLEWIQCDMGDHVKMGYPSYILKGNGASAKMWQCTLVSSQQEKDIGAKMIHLGENTKSSIMSQAIVMKDASLTERNTINITKKAKNSKNDVKCDTIIIDECSKNDKIPKNTISNRSSHINYEAHVSKNCPSWIEEILEKETDEEKMKLCLLSGAMSRMLPEKQKKLWMKIWNKYKGEL